jgi:Uma2 family endonuclease
MAVSVIERSRKYTPEEFEQLPDAELYELLDGCLVERNMSFYSGAVGTRLLRRVSKYLDGNDLGETINESQGLQIFPGRPNRVVFTDGAFIRRERLPARYQFRGWGHIAPDLVWEVVSPTDLAEEVQGKALDYLSAGVRMVWVVYPRTRHVDVYRIDGSNSTVREAGTLSGEDILPGFQVVVGELFPPVEDEDPTE